MLCICTFWVADFITIIIILNVFSYYSNFVLRGYTRQNKPVICEFIYCTKAPSLKSKWGLKFNPCMCKVASTQGRPLYLTHKGLSAGQAMQLPHRVCVCKSAKGIVEARSNCEQIFFMPKKIIKSVEIFIIIFYLRF